MTTKPQIWLTMREVCAQLGVSRSTIDDWRRRGAGPEFKRLPNGSLRIRQSTLDEWVDAQEVA
jgi:excisionase family DNA binding protein